METFSPVWITSRAHLAKCQQVVQSAGKITKAIGKGWIPDELPLLHAVRFYPCPFFNSGKLWIENGGINFKADYPDLQSMYSVERIDLKLQFRLDQGQIKSLTRWREEKPYFRGFKFEWIVVTCDASVLEGEFLMAHGHTNFRPRRTNKLTTSMYERLRRI